MLELLSRFQWRAPALEMGRECTEIFPDKAGKASLISSYEAEKGLLWMWQGPSFFLLSGDGNVRQLLCCSKGVRTFWKSKRLGVISFEKPQRKRASSRLEGKTSWIFSNWGRCSLLTTGTSGTRSGRLRKDQSPCQLLWGLSGFLSLRCRSQRPCVESSPEPEDSSPVLTWILGYVWSLPRGDSSRMGACTCAFLHSVSSSVTLPVAEIKGSVAFPRGFPPRLSHRAVPRATVVGVDPRRESRGSAGKTGSFGMD